MSFSDDVCNSMDKIVLVAERSCNRSEPTKRGRVTADNPRSISTLF